MDAGDDSAKKALQVAGDQKCRSRTLLLQSAPPTCPPLHALHLELQAGLADNITEMNSDTLPTPTKGCELLEQTKLCIPKKLKVSNSRESVSISAKRPRRQRWHTPKVTSPRAVRRCRDPAHTAHLSLRCSFPKPSSPAADHSVLGEPQQLAHLSVNKHR